MAWGDFGYMEGDELGKPYDMRLLSRLAAQAKPMARTLLLAGLIIMFSAGLDLVLPYLTRQAIDGYILRQAYRVELSRAEPQFARRLETGAKGDMLRGAKGVVFVPERIWRDLDPRLSAAFVKAGLVDRDPWYLAPDDPGAKQVAAQQPDWFAAAGGRLLIAPDNLSRLSAKQTALLRGSDLSGLGWLALIFTGTSIMGFLLGFCQDVLLERAGQRVMLDLRRRLYTHLLSRSVDFFSKNPVGKLVTRLTNDVNNINEMFRNTLVALCQDVFILTGIVAMLLWLDQRLAALCLSLVPVISLMAYFFARLARNAFRAMQGHLGRINSFFNETLSGLNVVKLFRAEAQGMTEFKRLNNDYYRAGLMQVKVFAVFMPLSDLFASLAVGLIVWYGGGQVVRDQLSLGTLVAFLFYVQKFFRPVRDIAEKYNILQAAMASAERIFHLLDDDTELPRPEKFAPVPADGKGRVEFKGVSFGYDPQKPVVLGAEFVVPEGQTWAVVGPTGAGKTSLVNLLLRAYDPQHGTVGLDGVDLRNMAPAELSRMVCLVPQEVFLFAGTVRENIHLDRSWVDEASLRQALSVSGAADFISELPDGLETRVGEGGRGLSAGQKQLIALARALAGSPRVLILDEATASVDPESERLIQKALPAAMAGRTSLVVAHRLSTIQHADMILVMSKGRIVERGKHDELLRSGGLYGKLVRLNQLKARES